MFIFKPFVGSWREFNLACSQAARNLQLHSLRIPQRKVIYPPDQSFNSSVAQFDFQSEKYINSSVIFKKINIIEIINFLNKDGFSLGINLPIEITQEIWEFAKNTLCYGNNNPNLGFFYSQKEQAQVQYATSFATGYYDNTALLCSAIQYLESDPILLTIATQYLESESIHEESQLWWNFPVESTVYERRRSAQRFHRESETRRCLQFFFYITNVDLCSSPHICVRGSHHSKSLSGLYRPKEFSYQEIVQHYGYQSLVPICGKVGSGFVEDPRCFHKKAPPSSQERLTLQIQFSIKP